jgi:hypothetical protein
MVLRHHIVLLSKGLFALVVLAVASRHHAAFAAGAVSGGVTGIVFLDTNGNGVRDRDEPGFSGVVVTLFGKKTDGRPLYLTTRTDTAGRFAFAGALIGDGSNFTVSTGGAPLAATIPTTYHPARTFYTSSDGSDHNPGTRERPFRSIAKAVSMLAAGDLLYIRQGEYREPISSTKTPLGSGSGWDRPIVVAGMPGETVVVRPPDREGRDPLINLTSQRQQYLVFDNLVLDAEDVTVPLMSQSRDGTEPPPSRVRVINSELKNAKGSAVFVAGDEYQFINCRIHDNGHSSKDHGLYVSGGHNRIQGCDIYHNSGWGVYLYSGSADTANDNVIRGNRIHDNGLSGRGGFGIGLHSGRKNLVYDNVIWANPFGIVVAAGAEEPNSNNTIQGNRGPTEQSIFNNTIYGNHGPGIAIAADNETRDNVVRNNIAIGNRDPNVLNRSSTTVIDHNLVQGNPRFRDPQAHDFHLQPGSMAIDAGVAIAEVRSDHDGIPRPQGKGYDLGAYEYSDHSFVPTTSTVSGIFPAGQTYRVVIGFAKNAKKQ